MPTRPAWLAESEGHPADAPAPATTARCVSLIVRSMARSTLTEALDSIARQTYPAIEVIVVNAHGPGHPPLGEQCGPFPLRFVDQGRPLERSAAANAGLDAARGAYLGFLDDDDVLFPEHVATLANALQCPPPARVAYSGVQMIAYQPDGAPGCETVLNQPFHLPSLRAQNYIPMHAVLFDRALVEAGCRFDERLTLYEDWDFWLQLAQHSEFRHVDRLTACYRNFGHSGFGLHADADKITAGRAALFDKWRNIWSGAELSEALAALRDGVIHRQPHNRAAESLALERLAERLIEQDALLRQMLAWLERDRQDREALRESQRRLDALTALTAPLRAQLTEQSRRLDEVYRSTSWRITAPLRGLRHILRRWRRSAPG